MTEYKYDPWTLREYLIDVQADLIWLASQQPTGSGPYLEYYDFLNLAISNVDEAMNELSKASSKIENFPDINE